MPQVEVTTRRFPRLNQWSIQNGHQALNVSIPEILHAAVTVGHPSNAVVFGGGAFAAASEMLWKVSGTLAALRGSSGHFIATQRFDRLDPSEKRGLTYQMGLTFNKMLAWRLFRVRWLMHLDVYHDTINPILHSGRSRPDLVGVDSQNNWYVFEAKGRSSPPNSADKQKAKAQSSRIVSIDGKTPKLAASCFTYFRKDDYWGGEQKKVECFLEDPPFDEDPSEIDIKKHALKITKEQLILDYYKPALSLFTSDSIYEDENRLSWIHERADITVQIEKWLLKAIHRQDAKKILYYFYNLDSEVPKNSDDRENSGYDGISVILGDSWKDTFNSKR